MLRCLERSELIAVAVGRVVVALGIAVVTGGVTGRMEIVSSGLDPVVCDHARIHGFRARGGSRDLTRVVRAVIVKALAPVPAVVNAHLAAASAVQVPAER